MEPGSQPSIRFAVHPEQSKAFDTAQLRATFLVNKLFERDSVELVYTHYDRFVVGGAMPVSKPLDLTPPGVFKSSYFLERRELGIINVGGPGTVLVDDEEFQLDYREALYVGRAEQKVRFARKGDKQPLFYFNSAPAHSSHPTRKITLAEAETVELGSSTNANARTIRKLIVQPGVQTCQLQMGLTELKPGSMWNSMPPHTHDRRMEVYFYFDIPEGNSVCHFMGLPQETRHLWIHNHQAAISPPWSIHCGSGTSAYSFIWGMAGENLDYSDMDQVKQTELR